MLKFLYILFYLAQQVKFSIVIVRTFAYNKDKSVQMENSDSEGGLVDYDR